ncbi:putative licABCH operon regulator [Leuconostoc mesenteroides]|uniref:BglG family transcription antiterminator n=1 Tax=Leuconostoc mesenteroides TaxID=1245 RepID=UPI000CF9EAF6|nr:BglG family transcription antiterminator [Leuconostoc mesenteroides]SPE11663.1 putative licABCH operon regulator [Leuconostoc mesenteroides]SPI59310.1 putative licABCH operon regulator [Leuconostoc mesenteroides]
MRKKERDLLIYLVDNSDRFVTSEELSTLLSLTPRTIRNYIKILKETLVSQGALLDAKPSLGYRLHISHPVTFDLFLNKNYELSQWLINEGSNNISDRQKYILNKLIIENQKFLIDDLAEKLFVTRTTLSKDLSIIRKVLMPYRISVESKANIGVFITGLERDKRHFILDYFFSHSENSIQHYMKNKSFFKAISFDQITIIVLDECREAGIHLTDFTIQNIVLYIALSVQRLKCGFELQDAPVDINPEIRNVSDVARKIFSRIESGLALKFPESEVDYLTIQLMAQGKNINIQNDGPLQRDLDMILQRIELETDYPVTKDYALKKNIIEHLKPMIVRLEQGIQLKNPLLQEIKTNYLSEFMDTKRYIKLSPYLSQFDINDDEVAYLALHLMAAAEKYKNLNKPRALIICATGYGSAQLLNNRVEKEFGMYLNIVDIKGYYEVDDTTLSNVNLIISAIDLSTRVFKVPVIQVSIFLTEADVQKINEFLDNEQVRNKYIAVEKKQPINSVLNHFDQFIDQSSFKIWQVSPHRKELLQELTNMLMSNEPTELKHEFLEQIDQREQLSSIVFSDTIAVPHPAMPMSRVPKIAIGIIPNGVRWSDEHSNIQLVFLLSPSYRSNQGLTETTQAIVKFTENIEEERRLVASRNFSEIRHNFLLMMKGGKYI